MERARGHHDAGGAVRPEEPGVGLVHRAPQLHVADVDPHLDDVLQAAPGGLHEAPDFPAREGLGLDALGNGAVLLGRELAGDVQDAPVLDDGE